MLMLGRVVVVGMALTVLLVGVEYGRWVWSQLPRRRKRNRKLSRVEQLLRHGSLKKCRKGV